MQEIQELFVEATDTVRQTMQRIDRWGSGMVMLVDDQQRLRATITDGDIRRAILAGISVDDSVATLLAHRDRGRSAPVTASADGTPETWMRTIRETGVTQLPLVDADGRVVDLYRPNRPPPTIDSPVRAVIMAGGFGKRLAPLTDRVPKPMLSIAGRPLMEHTIEGLRRAGIHRIHITTHYLSDKITDHFGDGREFGVEVDYVSEDQPLGTAGALRLVEAADEPLLVINGDILTHVDYRKLLAFHKTRDADLTVGVVQYGMQVPYGVIDAENGRVRSVREKPKYDFLVNSGIYLLDPSVCRLIPAACRFDMTDLIARLLEEGRTVACFPIVEYWIDIGHLDDFQRAQHEVREMRRAS